MAAANPPRRTYTYKIYIKRISVIDVMINDVIMICQSIHCFRLIITPVTLEGLMLLVKK